ncbi:MAG: hypothetical protein GEU75_15415, partial [Dehalococcoidia bacterium]|nr:hypothetical protein [Dehalococcoidia bacterium]
MPVIKRTIKPGDTFIVAYKGIRYDVAAVEEDGKLLFRGVFPKFFREKPPFANLDEAADAVAAPAKGSNGWDFWTHEADWVEPPNDENDPNVIRIIHPVGSPSDNVWSCEACNATFEMRWGEKPAQ